MTPRLFCIPDGYLIKEGEGGFSVLSFDGERWEVVGLLEDGKDAFEYVKELKRSKNEVQKRARRQAHPL